MTDNTIIDQLCDAFEAEWNDNSQNLIERYLKRSEAVSSGGLLSNLLQIELELRSQ